MKIKTNLWGGVLFVVLGIVLWLLVPSQIPEPLIETPGIAPRLVPRLVIGIMFLGGLTLIIQSLVFKKEKIVEVHLKYEKTALIVSLIMGVYALLVYLVGFLIGTVVSVAL
ncbi:MAG: hypothetical protein MJA31_20885, partial [Clostridia bacterium]|nr:hypothetical protein [Clostridia bacterium]